MRLERLKLTGFRSCYESIVEFPEHLTLLVGENDAGKSNIIDALRVTVPPVSGRPTIWFDADRDLSYGLDLDSIAIERRYSGLTRHEDAFYTPALVDSHRNLVHTTEFKTDPMIPRRHRVINTVGESRIPDPEPESRERVAHVYLPPLRDAARSLDSADGNRLADVFELLASPTEIETFERLANEALGRLASHDTARRVISGIQAHLTSVTQPVRHRIVDVKHRDQRLRRIVRALRLQMAAAGLTPSDLLGSGLGYANLLYIATVVLEIEKANEYDLLLLLVEEPEAHLHPQLQTVLLSYLREQAIESAKFDTDGAGRPTGRIQVIASSHSPHLASSVSTKNVVVLRCQDRESSASVGGLGGAATESGEEPPPPRYTETIAISLSTIDLKDSERRKIDRYLDVTRASLLFARQVILVEGIAEAMLLRAFAERLVFPRSSDSADTNGELNRQMREQFRAISVLAIDGVDFIPYLRILLGGHAPLVDRAVIITDGDDGAGNKREAQIRLAFPGHVDAGRLSVFVGATTLEAELFALSSNEALLRAAFQELHPRSLTKWDALQSGGQSIPADRATTFAAALKAKTLDIGKGDFAHVISELLESESAASFQLPAYLERAIHAAVLSGG